MLRRLSALLVIITVGLSALAPVAAQAASTVRHSCCRTIQALTAPQHGCAGTTPVMRCCAPASERSSSPLVPPASASSSHHPDLTPLKGDAGHALAGPGLVARAVADAFEWARLKLPHDPVYLRHLVLLV